MDIVAELEGKIAALSVGDYLTGLNSVRQHIAIGFRHYARGRSSGDDAAFTDAIYRTNQAFEGSIKESYRVLANRDPAKQRPYDIERYLEKNNIFRSRVLDQFTNYRTTWRNPSTHDYNLNFDASEAFLALCSVTAFACLLLDQIAEKISYANAQAKIDPKSGIKEERIVDKSRDLIEVLADIIVDFCSDEKIFNEAAKGHSVMLGAIHAYIHEALPESQMKIDEKIRADNPSRVDILLQQNQTQIVIEIKKAVSGASRFDVLHQVTKYLDLLGSREAIVFYYSDKVERMLITQLRRFRENQLIYIISPERLPIFEGLHRSSQIEFD